MEEHKLISLAGIIIIGGAAQWLAMRLKLPSILFLLIFGFISGPVLGWINPDQLFGDLLFPIISLSVAIILFEGGMDLKLHELKGIGRMIWNLISVGVLVTWVMISAAAYYILHLELSMAILTGGMLVVTGPTVIGPLLRHIRPTGRVGHIVKWEGIMIDPVGVLLAILIFEVILSSSVQAAGSLVIWGIIKTVFLSSLVGVLCAIVLIFFLKNYLIPEALHILVTLMFIFIAFIVSNMLQEESGLLAVTLMGIVLANQKQVSVHHILQFKENLRVLIISFLFIVLAARMDITDLQYINADSLIFVLLLVLVIRPISVFVSAIGTDLNIKEKIFISWIAPRGIVAAAMASIFSYELTKHGHGHVETMVPLVFLVIVSTVAIYGLTIKPLGKYLGICQDSQQGVLIMGAHRWARDIASVLNQHEFKVLIVDTNSSNIRLARKEGLTAQKENILNETAEEHLDLNNIGRMFCMTSNDEANGLAAVRYQDIFGLENVFQIVPEITGDEEEESISPIHLRGRYLFNDKMDFIAINKLFASGALIKEKEIEEAFDWDQFMAQRKNDIYPLFVIHPEKKLSVIAVGDFPELTAGDKLVYISNKT